MQNVNISQVNKISYEFVIENAGYEIRIVNNNDSRVNKIKELIRSNHLNEEERESIIKICEQYGYISFIKLLFYNNNSSRTHN